MGEGRVSFGYLPASIRPPAHHGLWWIYRGGIVPIDARSPGGRARYDLHRHSRLTAAPYTAYAKVARSDPGDPTKLTEPQASVVCRARAPVGAGRWSSFTSRYSVSAAETFTQALMGRRPAITRVGENTQGVFSDVLGRTLPNGWRMGLPNELFLTEQGTSFDGPGTRRAEHSAVELTGRNRRSSRALRRCSRAS